MIDLIVSKTTLILNSLRKEKRCMIRIRFIIDLKDNRTILIVNIPLSNSYSLQLLVEPNIHLLRTIYLECIVDTISIATLDLLHHLHFVVLLH